MNPPSPNSDLPASHDFDFLHGRWHLQNRKRLKLLQDADDWETFEATQHVRPLPGGIGNYDDFIAPTWRPGFVGMTLRVFNPLTQCWSIYWLTNRTGGLNQEGLLDPAVVGRFENGIGLFECADQFEGRPIRMRFRWSKTSPENPRWEQAFSPDEGKTWETNWEMSFTRLTD